MPEPADEVSGRGGAWSWSGVLLPLAVVVAGAVLFLTFRQRVPFDAHAVWRELRAVSGGRVSLALGTIYGCYWMRAARWAVLSGSKRAGGRAIGAAELFPSQLIGFTAVALFGRVADLGRPYLVARRLGKPLARQLGVYSVERTLDLGAAAVVFSATLALAPSGTPHHEAYARAGLLSLAATALFAAFAVGLGRAGGRFGEWLATRVRPRFPRVAEVLETRLLQFQEGLRSGANWRELLVAMTLSLLMWLGIAGTYVLTARAFVACPPLATLTLPQAVLLMAVGMGGSLLQLPVLGWFTQTALLSAALHEFFAVPLGPATAAGALLFLVANLSVVPGGLLAARLTGTRLRPPVRGREDRAENTAAASAGEPGRRRAGRAETSWPGSVG